MQPQSQSQSQSQNTTGRTLLWLIIFLLAAHGLLSYIGLVPSEVSRFNQQVIEGVKNISTLSYSSSAKPILPRASLSSTQQEVVVGEQPGRIEIEKINVDAPISTPEEATVPVLDEALKEGVVHYPGSGGLGGTRPMFLFGHSSRLPVVQNQAYRSFNGLDKLVAGDIITIHGQEVSYTYQVTSVEVVDKDEALVSFTGSGDKLTLSTCTTFGARENRVVVEAELQSQTARTQ